VIGAAITIGRVPMSGQNDLNTHRCGAIDRRIEVIDLEPKEEPVAGRLIVPVADASVMMFGFPSVKLQHERTRVYQSLVVRPAMVALAVEQLSVPPAARLDIADAD
jgi:hypothetical protein